MARIDIREELAREWSALAASLAPSVPADPRPLFAKPPSVTLLFAELEEVRCAWQELRRSPDLAEDAERLVTSQWTLRDLLSHVASWSTEFRREAEATLAGRGVDYEIYFEPRVGPTEWNHARVAERKSQTLDEIFDEIDAATRRLQELVLAAPPDVLYAPREFAPVMGPERRPMMSSLAELAGVLPFHDRHHLGRIAAWRASLR